MIEELSGVLNTALGLEYCGEMEDLYEDMLRDYVDSDRVGELNDLFAAQDWTNYRVSIHGVKSTTLMIGGEALSAKAKELELAAADGNIDFIKANHEQVMAEYSQLLDTIRKVV